MSIFKIITSLILLIGAIICFGLSIFLVFNNNIELATYLIAVAILCQVSLNQQFNLEDLKEIKETLRDLKK